MHLENISLTNFKNYEEISINFSAKINCIVGLNGSGKTNLLDAIHYLCITKSAFNYTDSQLIRHSENFLTIRGTFKKGTKSQTVSSGLQPGKKKVFQVNKAPYERLSDHLGHFPVVLIAPNDTSLINDGSELRRKYFDSIISQIDKAYLEDLVAYNHVLKQRNALLKHFSESHRYDADHIEPYNLQLITLAKKIALKRSEFTEKFNPEFLNNFSLISENKENVSLHYDTKVQDDFEKSFRDAIRKDIVLQRTTLGIHRDDFVFLINEHSVKKFASQGQQKSYLVALKLAQFESMRDALGLTPILLLDDIFDKLDDERIKSLIEILADKKFEQLFITDARKERTEKILKESGQEVEVFEIEKGTLVG